MDFISFPLWKRWLLHSFIIWVITNVYGSVSYAFQGAFINGNVFHYTLWQRLQNWNLAQPTIIYILLTILFVEINVYLCKNKKIRTLILGSFITGAAVWLILAFSFQFRHGFGMVSSSVPFFLVSGYAFSYPIFLELLSHRIIHAEKQFEKSSAELNALKSQIHPHFLFNTLNSLYGTAIREEATDTASGIERLANMMRYVLNEAAEHFVPVSQEIKFIEEYLDLQRMRLPSTINEKVSVVITYDQTPVKIAPLLLIPFIENAFKYGIDINQESFVSINISIINGKFHLSISNSITNAQPGAGTGVANAKKRLELLYPGRYSLTIKSNSSEYHVHLEITL